MQLKCGSNANTMTNPPLSPTVTTSFSSTKNPASSHSTPQLLCWNQWSSVELLLWLGEPQFLLLFTLLLNRLRYHLRLSGFVFYVVEVDVLGLVFVFHFRWVNSEELGFGVLKPTSMTRLSRLRWMSFLHLLIHHPHIDCKFYDENRKRWLFSWSNCMNC